ncbi:Down syndrome cell adhesion molecule-like protein Dscam2, partial [Leptotrombidium deliense]
GIFGNSNSPKLASFPLFSPFTEDRPFTTVCTIQDGSLPISFFWKFNQKLINNNFGIEIEKSESSSFLKINKLKQTHSGNYTCTAINTFGEDSQTFTLLVKGPLKWITEPTDVQFKVKSEGVVECKASGNPIPRIIWKRNDKEHSSVDGKLVFKQVELEDAGKYDCIVDNGVETPLVKSITVKVNAQVSPQILPVAPFTSITEHSRFVFFCSVSQGTSPLFFSWSKDGKSIDKTNSRIKTDELISTLTVDEVTSSDSGNYTCTVRNAFGKDTQTVTLLVK